jgi:hypothetical protein
MSLSMVTRDAETFVALGRAMSLAAEEGALEAAAARDLAAALVAAILTGSMDLDTYAQIHEALARLLELTFASGESREASTTPGPRTPAAEGEESLGGYLEVVGEAWDKVTRGEEGSDRVRGFIRSCFDLAHARFGGECWFEAPLLISPEELVQRARAAGLLIVAIEPAAQGIELKARLCPPDATREANCGRVVLGWGERRANLSLAAAA